MGHLCILASCGFQEVYLALEAVQAFLLPKDSEIHLCIVVSEVRRPDFYKMAQRKIIQVRVLNLYDNIEEGDILFFFAGLATYTKGGGLKVTFKKGKFSKSISFDKDGVERALEENSLRQVFVFSFLYCS